MIFSDVMPEPGLHRGDPVIWIVFAYDRNRIVHVKAMKANGVNPINAGMYRTTGISGKYSGWRHCLLEKKYCQGCLSSAGRKYAAELLWTTYLCLISKISYGKGTSTHSSPYRSSS